MNDLFTELTPQEIAVLEERARALARSMEEEADLRQMVEVLTFQIANEVYAVQVEHVREVRPLKRLSRVPGAPEFVVGVVNLRGSIYSLVDIRKFFGIARQEIADMMHMIMVEAAGLEVGILVRKVGEVIQQPLSEFVVPPLSHNEIAADYVTGVSPDGIILLNLKAILPNMIVNEAQ